MSGDTEAWTESQTGSIEQQGTRCILSVCKGKSNKMMVMSAVYVPAASWRMSSLGLSSSNRRTVSRSTNGYAYTMIATKRPAAIATVALLEFDSLEFGEES